MLLKPPARAFVAEYPLIDLDVLYSLGLIEQARIIYNMYDVVWFYH